MMSEKLQKLAFVPLRRAENSKNWLSYPYDELKTVKTGFRLQAKSKKWEKQRFACKRRAKNGENSVSLASDGQKTQKTGFRLQAKCKKREKQRFACKRRVKSFNFRISAQAESQNHPKTAFPPRRKAKSAQRQVLQKKILIAHWSDGSIDFRKSYPQEFFPFFFLMLSSENSIFAASKAKANRDKRKSESRTLSHQKPIFKNNEKKHSV